jgi:hypothetical protein
MDGSGFESKWANSKAARIGYLIGRGRTAKEVSAELADGTGPGLIRSMLSHWGLSGGSGRRCNVVPVALSGNARRKLASRSAKRDLAPEEYVRRIVVCVLQDDLFDAVTEGFGE